MNIIKTDLDLQVTTIGYLTRTNKNGKKEYMLGKHHKQHKWNGFGGKVGDKEKFKDESIEQSLAREGREEFGVDITDPVKIGEVLFDFYDQNEEKQLVLSHIYLIEKFKGEPKATSEMLSPSWFTLESIPWDEMWPHDKLWLGELLSRSEFLRAELVFDKNDNVISSEMNWESSAKR